MLWRRMLQEKTYTANVKQEKEGPVACSNSERESEREAQKMLSLIAAGFAVYGTSEPNRHEAAHLNIVTVDTSCHPVLSCSVRFKDSNQLSHWQIHSRERRDRNCNDYIDYGSVNWIDIFATDQHDLQYRKFLAVNSLLFAACDPSCSDISF